MIVAKNVQDLFRFLLNYSFKRTTVSLRCRVVSTQIEIDKDIADGQKTLISERRKGIPKINFCIFTRWMIELTKSKLSLNICDVAEISKVSLSQAKASG